MRRQDALSGGQLVERPVLFERLFDAAGQHGVALGHDRSDAAGGAGARGAAGAVDVVDRVEREVKVHHVVHRRRHVQAPAGDMMLMEKRGIGIWVKVQAMCVKHEVRHHFVLSDAKGPLPFT